LAASNLEDSMTEKPRLCFKKGRKAELHLSRRAAVAAAAAARWLRPMFAACVMSVAEHRRVHLEFGGVSGKPSHNLD
jgi:hypothetical protein